METLSINFLIKDSPTAVAIVDTKLRFINYSQIWLEEFGQDSAAMLGKSYFDLLPDIHEKLKVILNNCLKGESNSSKGTKFIHPNGRIQWLKWKINPWKNKDDSIGGLIIIHEDVTEERRREELLLTAEKVARIGGWELDVEQAKVYWTHVTREIHEVDDDFVPNLEDGINFYKKGSSREIITALVSEAMASGTPWDIELQIVTAKGNELWVHTKGETEIINGKCTRVFGTFQDIDQKKRTEMEYQKVSDRLAIATKTARIGIWDYNLVDNELIWDGNMYLIYGIDKKDFNGEYEAWQSGLHPDDLNSSETALAQAIEGKKEFNTEFRIIWPDGTVRYIKARGSVIRDSNGQPIKMVGANWDITEFRNTKMRLLRSQESFSGAFGESAIGMALVSLEGKWMEVNQSLCKSFGYTKKELLNKTFQEITFPEDLENDMVILNNLVSRKISSCQIDKRFYHKNGQLVHVFLTVTAVNDIDGNLSHFIAQIVDISSRIEAEKRLKTLVDVTKGQNESLMNFAHIVSHNLRSHSSNMSMLTKFMAQEKNPNERGNIEAMLGKAADSLNETVQHLNEVVLVRTGTLEKMRSVSLISAVESVVDTIVALLKEKNATYEFNICKTHYVNVVPAYLDSIILNLFTNSLKYSSPKRAPIVKISSEIKKDFIQVSFSDNGLGIDLTRHGEKIFGMYKTFHKHKDAKGIGLFITKNQIESMYGSISVKSKLDEGTTFTLKFKKA